MSIVGFGGWLLERAVQIDVGYPGFAGHLLRSSSERRHVISAYLSITRPARRFDSERELGKFLCTADHEAILAAAFGSAPQGFRSCLGKGGNQPYSRWHYRYLYLLLATDTRPGTWRLLSSLKRVNPTRLRVARALSAELRRPNIVMAIAKVGDARDLSRVFTLLLGAGVNRTAMVQGLETGRDMSDVRRLVARWSLQVTLPPHPVPASLGYQPLTTGTEVRAMSLQMRNCGRTYIAKLLEGRSAFATVVRGSDVAAVHLVRRDDSWMLDDVYGPSNHPAEPELERWTVDYLKRFGIRRVPRRSDRGEWSCLQRLAGYYDLDAA